MSIIYSENFPVSHLSFSIFNWLSKSNILLNRKETSTNGYYHIYYFFTFKYLVHEKRRKHFFLNNKKGINGLLHSSYHCMFLFFSSLYEYEARKKSISGMSDQCHTRQLCQNIDVI